MKQLTFIIIFISIILSACGPSEQEVREKLRIEEQSQKTADSLLQVMQADKEKIEQYIIEAKAQLEAELSTMEKIKQFKLGRAQWEKEEQIKNQSILIQTLEKNIKEAEKQLELYQ